MVVMERLTFVLDDRESGALYWIHSTVQTLCGCWGSNAVAGLFWSGGVGTGFGPIRAASIDAISEFIVADLCV